MTKKSEQTEVVKIRLGSETKNKLMEAAEREYRTFADQCRMILDEWLSKNGKK